MRCRYCKYYCRGEYNISYEEAKKYIEQGAILIDVRSIQEYKEGHLEGSINISLYDFNNIEEKIQDKNRLIILYCEYGIRSNKARKILLEKGYKNVYTIAGGLNNI